jgi:hypothetical protein
VSGSISASQVCELSVVRVAHVLVFVGYLHTRIIRDVGIRVSSERCLRWRFSSFDDRLKNGGAFRRAGEQARGVHLERRQVADPIPTRLSRADDPDAHSVKSKLTDLRATERGRSHSQQVRRAGNPSSDEDASDCENNMTRSS